MIVAVTHSLSCRAEWPSLVPSLQVQTSCVAGSRPAGPPKALAFIYMSHLIGYSVLTPGLEVRSSHKVIEMCILEPSRIFVNMGLSHLMDSCEPGRKPLCTQATSPAFLRRCYATSVTGGGAAGPCGCALLPEARKRWDLSALLVPSARLR